MKRSGTIGALVSAALLAAGSIWVGTAAAADPSPGQSHDHPRRQRQRGRRHLRPGLRAAYAGTTTDGTPVYIYVPAGRRSIGRRGVASLDPQFDPNPSDAFMPCATTRRADFMITQAQINTLGDELASQIVAVDEEHYGAIGLADPSDPASDALVVLVYNVQDDSYYDCDATTVHGRLLRARLHRRRRHERHRRRRVRLGEPGRPRPATTTADLTCTRA